MRSFIRRNDSWKPHANAVFADDADAGLENVQLATRAEHPDYLLLSGGTDVMVGALHRPHPPGGVA